MSTIEGAWIGCPLCVTQLSVVRNLPGEVCVACGRLMDDPMFEALAGHLACCDPKTYGVPSKCNVHVCRDCRDGPIVLSSGVAVSAKEVARVWHSGYTCKECARIAAPNGVLCGTTKCKGKNIDLVWDTLTHMKCLNCELTSDRVSSDFVCKCGKHVKTTYIGRPRVLPDRRRPRSPSPQNVETDKEEHACARAKPMPKRGVKAGRKPMKMSAARKRKQN